MDAKAWNARYDTTELVWHADPNQFVRSELSSVDPGSGLDLACGEGRNAIWLAGLGWTMTAVDFSERAIEKAEALARDHDVDVTFDVADATRLEPTDPFDLVLWSYLQLREPDRGEALRRAAAAVTPGGLFLLIAHDRSNLEDGYGGPRDPEVLTTPDMVTAALGDGFVIERAAVVDRVVDTDDGPRIARDTLVRARRRGD